MKRFYKLSKVLFVMLLMFMVTACVTPMGEKMKPWTEMTPKERVTLAYGTYNSQYNSYMTETGWKMVGVNWEKFYYPELSKDRKDILRKKKDILTKLYPMLKVYDSMVLGTVPYSSDVEKEIFGLIDALVLLI